jgi:hypothetical protein
MIDRITRLVWCQIDQVGLGLGNRPPANASRRTHKGAQGRAREADACLTRGGCAASAPPSHFTQCRGFVARSALLWRLARID